MPDYQVKRGAYSAAPLEGISSAPGVVTHVRALTMTSMRRTQEPPANGGSTGREAAVLRSNRSDLKSLSQFCTQNRLDQATGRVKPRIAGTETPRGDAQPSPVDSPEKLSEAARSPEHRSQNTLQSTSVLTASKSLRGSANSRPTLRNNGTGTRTRSPSATSIKGSFGPGASPAPTPTRLFQSRDGGAANGHSTAARPGMNSSSSPRTTAAHSPKRKITQPLMVQVRPRSGSFTSGTGLATGNITSPGRGKATMRQTSAGAAVRKRSGPSASAATAAATAATPPLPRVEEEIPVLDTGVKRAVLCSAFDESNVVICYGESEEWDVSRPESLRFQVWWRQGDSSLTIHGLHQEPIDSVSLCQGARSFDTAGATPTSETSQSGGPEMEWLVTSSRSNIMVWRLDRLQKAVAEAMMARESKEDLGPVNELIQAITPAGVLKLAEKSLNKSYMRIWTYEGERDVPPSGTVMCRSSPRGHLVIASTRDPLLRGKIHLFFMSKQMELAKLLTLRWSEPLGDCLVTDVVAPGPFPQERSQERVNVWFAGVGAKLYSTELFCKEKQLPVQLMAHMNLQPNIPVSCLCGSAKRVGRCYVGCQMAQVQIMEWREGNKEKAYYLGKVQIPGEDATVLSMRSMLRGEEEVLAMMLDHAIYLQGLVTGLDDRVSQSGSATMVVSLKALGCSIPTMMSMNNSTKSFAAVHGNFQLAWFDEESNTLRLAPVKLGAKASVAPIKETPETKIEQRRPSVGNERGSPMTTPRGGTVRRKPLNGAGAFAPRPASSRGESNTATTTAEGRKDGRRMVSGPVTRAGTTGAGKATVLNVARTVKRQPRNVPQKASTDSSEGPAAPSQSEGELQARIDRVPSPATQRQRSLEAVHAARSHDAPSARTDRQESHVPDEQWAAKVARYQQHQTWAPPAGTHTPLWRVKGASNLSHVGHVNSNPISHITRGPSLDLQPATTMHPPGPPAPPVGAAPQTIQGLSSWPTVWIPQAVPVASSQLGRHSMGQTALQPAVSAPMSAAMSAPMSAQALMGPMGSPMGPRGMMGTVSAAQVVLEDADPLSRSRRNQPFVQSLPTAHPAFLHRWPFH